VKKGKQKREERGGEEERHIIRENGKNKHDRQRTKCPGILALSAECQ